MDTEILTAQDMEMPMAADMATPMAVDMAVDMVETSTVGYTVTPMEEEDMVEAITDHLIRDTRYEICFFFWPVGKLLMELSSV